LVQAVTTTVEWGSSEAEALDMLPGTVTATLDDDSTVSVNVDRADAIPGFDGQDARSESPALAGFQFLPKGV